jgi:hypothetical protein
VIVPAVIEEVDAIIEGSADDLRRLCLAGIANVIAAEADDRNLLARMAKRPAGNAATRGDSRSWFSSSLVERAFQARVCAMQ